MQNSTLYPVSNSPRSRWAALSLFIVITIGVNACKSPEFTGFSYDPAGVTITTDKPIDPQAFRTIGFQVDGVWFTNEFSGGRMNDVIRTGVDSFKVTVHPENRPINNSPWYSFSVYSETEKTIHIELDYPGHRHRYLPKISQDRVNWVWAVDSLAIQMQDALIDSAGMIKPVGPESASIPALRTDEPDAGGDEVRAIGGDDEQMSNSEEEAFLNAVDTLAEIKESVALSASSYANKLSILVGNQPIWVSAQELSTRLELDRWLSEMSQREAVTVDTAGFSRQGYPIPHMVFTSFSTKDELPLSIIDSLRSTIDNESIPPVGVLLVVGRQHPPEIPGYLAMKYFLERVAMDGDSLSIAFRNRFEVRALPMLNPDGVENGHWRHNLGGIDLNRDWQFFNQPETRIARDTFLPLKDRPDRKVFYGIDFHSTSENIFYPIHQEIETFPEDLTYHWLEAFSGVAPLPYTVESFDTTSPIAKNWIWKTFGADAVTYEVDDAAPREHLEAFAHRSAEQLMILLNQAYDLEYGVTLGEVGRNP